MNKVPVVAVVHHGNHLYAPFWNFRNKRKVPLHTTMKLILTPEQIANMSVDEINATLRRELSYDDYRYQKENGIRITESYCAIFVHADNHGDCNSAKLFRSGISPLVHLG